MLYLVMAIDRNQDVGSANESMTQTLHQDDNSSGVQQAKSSNRDFDCLPSEKIAATKTLSSSFQQN
jgi:hypothetical protein